MARSPQNGQILVGHAIHLMKIFRADQVFVGHDTLDGCDDEFIAQARLEFFQMAL